jgi:predicted DNA-binding protein with PD1-like motif
MEYRRFDKTYYIRADRGDEIISSILEVCRRENIRSAVYGGIGGCSSAEIQTFIPETGAFELREISGMLELVSLSGSITSDDNGELYHHTHAAFSFKNEDGHGMAAGHIKSVTVLYTAEIELRPVTGGVIKRKKDPETGTGFWSFCGECE